MPQSSDWTSRSVQQHGTGPYYRLNIPKSMGEGRDELEYKQLDDFLVVRPSRHKEGIEEFLVVRPSEEERGKRSQEVRADLEFPDEFVERGNGNMEAIMANILQSYWIAGIDEIDISPIDDEEVWNEIDDILMESQLPPLLEWDRRESTYHVKESLEFNEYVKIVSDFLEHHFIRFLSGKKEISDEALLNIESKEEDIDRYWALTSKQGVGTLFDLQVSEFPSTLRDLYIAKYLEMTADTAKDCMFLWYTFQEEFEDCPKLTKEIRKTLREVFVTELGSVDEGSFNEQIRELARKGFEQEIEVTDVKEQIDHLQLRRERLEELREYDQQGNAEAPLQAGVLMGEIISKSKHLSHFPRSIALAGFDARYFDKALAKRRILEF